MPRLSQLLVADVPVRFPLDTFGAEQLLCVIESLDKDAVSGLSELLVEVASVSSALDAVEAE